MKLTITVLRGQLAVAGLLLAVNAPAVGQAADQYPARIQPVSYNCPTGRCSGGGLFGCGCLHGSANGHAWVRPPATWGIATTPNTYNYYWNARLAGVPNGGQTGGLQYPMVYQPTDTTQMGFYYQAVPRWQYRAEMLPPAPVPYWPTGMNGGYGYVQGGTVSYSTAPATQPTNASPVTPAQPQTPGMAPPPPAEPAAAAPAVNVPEPEAAVFPNRRRR